MLLLSPPNVYACPLCPMQQYSRGNSSGNTQANSLKDLLQNKIDDMEKQVLSRVNTLEETKPASRNETEQRNRVESTLTSLHHRLTDLEKGTSLSLSYPPSLFLGISAFFSLFLRLVLAPTLFNFCFFWREDESARPEASSPQHPLRLETGNNCTEFHFSSSLRRILFIVPEPPLLRTEATGTSRSCNALHFSRVLCNVRLLGF